MAIDDHIPSSAGESAAQARILIVEDHPVVRFGLEQLVGSAPGLSVVAAVGNQQQADEVLKAAAVDIVLLDLMLGATDSLPLIERWVDRHRRLKILVVSAMQESVYAERVLRAGALGYVMKSVEMDELILAISSVLQGRVYLSPRIFVGLFRGLLHRSSLAKVPGAEGLSDRELQVFQLIGAGTANRDIAQQLGISVKTVEAHRENLKSKLGVANSADLASAARRFVESALG